MKKIKATSDFRLNKVYNDSPEMLEQRFLVHDTKEGTTVELWREVPSVQQGRKQRPILYAEFRDCPSKAEDM